MEGLGAEATTSGPSDQDERVCYDGARRHNNNGDRGARFCRKHGYGLRRCL